jgi:hypothetical protein
MPLKSKAQAAWMKHNKPAMFEKWRSETPKGKKLPARKGNSKGKGK